MAKAYLDYNATAPMREEVKTAMLEHMGAPLNPSSVHRSGCDARALIESARRKVQQAFGAENAEVVFTGCGTEANHLALLGSGCKKVIVSAIEHPSVLKIKAVTDVIVVDGQGIVDIEALEEQLRVCDSEKAMISVMLANNETGAIQPIKAIAALAKQYGAYVHVDAIQAAGKILVDFADLDVDFMSLSAHKIGAGAGAGALVMRKNFDLIAQQVGGGQEKRRRAGTENVLAIHAFGVAAELAAVELESEMKRQSILRDSLEARIKHISLEAVIFASDVVRLPNTSAIAMTGVHSQTQLIRFDLAGIELSAGSACSSGKVEMSHVLQAMGVKSEIAETMVRVSIGRETTSEEIDRFVNVWRELYTQTQAKAA